ncbi:MAG: AAA family ATPase [Patescibacteria group bacterium]|nr:AAA family ATPase [Patescibacteria group bacterium]MDE2439030.1 AAA family ATPase [Patescibacteria group bacterium]
MAYPVFKDPSFQDKLVAHLVKDGVFLKTAATYLKSEDFKPLPKQQEGWPRWIIGSLALSYWDKYRAPVRKMLKVEVLDYIQKNRVGEFQAKKLLQYVRWIRKQSLEAGDALLDKVLDFKRQKARVNAIDQILQQQEEGTLTDQAMLDICKGVVETFSPNGTHAVDFLSQKQVDLRVERRLRQNQSFLTPLFLIDPLDILINSIRRGQVGLWTGPSGRGKSLALIHTALAYVLQGYTTVVISLEDTKEDVEDRFDAALTQMPIRKLGELEKTFRIRFKRMRRMLRKKLIVIDATDQECTLPWIESQLEDLRDKGILVDALVIDYDDEIKPPKKYKAEASSRRMEFADIYRGLRRLAAKWYLYLWTAAQTTRESEKEKFLTGRHLAEDISKKRKVTIMIGIGNGGDVSPEALYLWVDKHKNDKKQVGTYIISDMDRGVFYNREKTKKLLDRMRGQTV